MSCSQWNVKRLKELCEYKTGRLNSNAAEEYGKYPFFTCSPEVYKINSFSFDQDAVLLAGNNANGKFHIKYYNGKFDAYQRTYVMKSKNNQKIDNVYLYYYLAMKLNYLKDISVGSATRFLTKSLLDNIEIKYPNYIEMKRIGTILRNIDNKIELNNEMNKTLEEMAQTLFKRWFVDFEFPNEDGEPYKSSGGEMVDSELGMIPKMWNCGSVSDISEKIYSGGTPKTSEELYWNGELAWMSSGETRNNFITKTDKKITNLGVKKSSTKLSNKYDTVIASAGQGLTRGQTSLLLIDTYINQSLICIKAKKELAFFTYINLKARYEELRAISDSHSIRGSLTTKMISQMQTIIPTDSVISKFNEIVSPILKNIESNLYQREELIEMRDLLLPKLISGEIALDDLKADL